MLIFLRVRRGVGKTAVAERFACALLGMDGSTSKSTPTAHPDFMRVSRPVEETEGGRKRDISIDSVRELTARLSLAAIHGTKVAIIDDADGMSVGAQNALLKTLEEPSGKAIIILITDDIEEILPTIRSRAVPLAFARVKSEAVELALMQRGISVELAREICLRSLGRPGVALGLLDMDVFQSVKDAEAKIRAFLEKPRAQQITDVGKLAKDEGSEEREVWFETLARELRLDLPRRADALSALLDARASLKRNANTSLALEHITLSL